MSLRVYMDVHIHVEITQGLRRRGVDVLTAQDDGTAEMADPDLLDRATALGFVLFSQDHDLLREAARRQRAGIPFAGSVFSEQLGVTIGEAVDQLELIAGVYEPAEFVNQVMYLPIR